MSDPLTHAHLDRLSEQLRNGSGVSAHTHAHAQAEYQRLNQQMSGGVPDALTYAKLLALRQELQQVRPQQPMPNGAAPADWQPSTEAPPSTRDAVAVAFILTAGLGWLLVPVEAFGAALLTWAYVGSVTGLNMRMADGSAIGGLHWDPWLAAGLSVVAAIAWVLLFMVPVAGPLVGLSMSVIWGLAAYVGTGSLAVGVFAFAASMLARIAMRTARRPWLAVAEWGVVASVALVVLAPIDHALPVPGFGGWDALRQVHDTQSCDKALRAGAWKGRSTETPAFFADRAICSDARRQARGGTPRRTS